MARGGMQMVGGGGGGVLRKVVVALVVLGVLALVVQHPANAADAVKGAVGFAESVVNGVSAFFGEFAK